MDFEKEAREIAQFVWGDTEYVAPPDEIAFIVAILRRAFAAGQENMRKHLSEHFHYVSNQAPKHETNLANAAKMVAIAIEQFKIPQN